MNSKEELKKGKGITMIALVVTIIVLLILAGVSISMLTGQNGILNRGAEAKDKAETAQTEEQKELADLEELKKNPTGSGEWKKQENNTFQNEEKKTVKIGEYVNYKCAEGIDLSSDVEEKNMYTSVQDPSEQIVRLVDNEDMKWQVIGIDGTGCLKLISSDSIKFAKAYYGESRNQEYALFGYIDAVSKLNKISSLFGKGKYAKSAEVVNVNDINTATGYVDNVYNSGTANASQTGNRVTYTMHKDGKVHYKGTKYPTTDTTSNRSKFGYYEGSKWKELNVGESVTLRNSSYSYYAQTLTTEAGSGANIKGKTDSTSVATYNMIFNNRSYWLGSQEISTNNGYAEYEIRFRFWRSGYFYNATEFRRI